VFANLALGDENAKYTMHSLYIIFSTTSIILSLYSLVHLYNIPSPIQ